MHADELSCPGDYRSKLEAKAEAVAQALSSGSFDFAFLHVKAVDDAGHDRLPWLKVCSVLSSVASVLSMSVCSVLSVQACRCAWPGCLLQLVLCFCRRASIAGVSKRRGPAVADVGCAFELYLHCSPCCHKPFGAQSRSYSVHI